MGGCKNEENPIESEMLQLVDQTGVGFDLVTLHAPASCAAPSRQKQRVGGIQSTLLGDEFASQTETRAHGWGKLGGKTECSGMYRLHSMIRGVLRAVNGDIPEKHIRLTGLIDHEHCAPAFASVRDCLGRNSLFTLNDKQLIL